MALCLNIYLIQQLPSEGEASIQSSLYVAVKNLISLLQATNPLSNDFLNCKVLATYYKLKHGLYSAAYMSIAECVRAARLLGLHRKCSRNMDKGTNEEDIRVWWAILSLERYINLTNGEALFMTEDPERFQKLPRPRHS
ncbi:hypothetical protein F5884DRAFT_811774 [Xylogone sp. PMI_703]|nr:hypothetical protein F5884DRAFT_811774 [Xylogone sp. PMI_703]